MAGNKDLNSAKTARKDEFYTQLSDIEKEMRHYPACLSGTIPEQKYNRALNTELFGLSKQAFSPEQTENGYYSG